MKKMILGSCLALVSFCGNCCEMNRSQSSDNLVCKKLIVYGDASKEHQRRLSDPVTQKEKLESVRRISVDDFLSMNESDAQQYNDVNFCNVEIDRACADKFWEVFNGMDNLLFDSCVFVDGCKFTDIFDGEYRVACLSLINCNIKLDDIDSILCLLYPYNIKKLNFQDNGLSGDAVRELMAKRLMSCAKSIDCSV